MANNRINLPLQLLYLRTIYADCIKSIENKNGKLVCIMTLRPSQESCVYKIKIECKQLGRPKVWLLSPPLKRVNGELPHHLYDKENKDKYPRLCMYDSRKGHDEFIDNKPWAYTLIPWVLSWLNTYEYWLITGKWHHAEVIKGERFD